MSKKDFIQAISLAYLNRDLYVSGDEGVSTRKTRNCPYRLLNILFSDEFAGDFGIIGDAGTRAELELFPGGSQRMCLRNQIRNQ